MREPTTQEPTIRRAVAQDAEQLTALVLESAAARGTYASLAAGYEVTPHYIARHEVYVAVDGSGAPLGFYALVLDPPEIDLAFVADAVQGSGVGRRLIQHMLGCAAQAGIRRLRVVAHPPTEKFYLRMGARRVGTVPPTPPRVFWPRPELRFELSQSAA